MYLSIFLGMFLVAFSAQSATLQGPNFLASLISESDAITIADIRELGQSGGIHTVQILVTLEITGGLQAGSQIDATYESSGRRGSSEVMTQVDRGLVFLRKLGSSKWEINYCHGPGIGVGEGYWPIPISLQQARDAEFSASSTTGKVVSVLAGAAEMEQVNRGIVRVFSSVVPPDLARPIYLKWQDSTNSKLRYLAYGGLIAQGDLNALRKATNEISPLSEQSIPLSASFVGWSSSDKESIRVIGSFGTTVGANELVSLNCALALSSIHSKETLPYLYILLDNLEPRVRELAVAGFSAFVLNMRPAATSMEASEVRDEVLNPGRFQQRSTGPYEDKESRSFVHFGHFQKQADDSSYVSYWRGWFETHRSKLTVP